MVERERDETYYDFHVPIYENYLATGLIHHNTGKTSLMVSTVRQDMDNGMGVIIIEREGNLFRQALDQVPPHRMNDVICIDFTRPNNPVGLNLLRLNKPEIIAGQFADLLDSVFPDSQRGVYSSQIVRHGIPVLASLPRATVADLRTLAHPRNPAEKAWARWAITQVKDKTYREFWEDWYKKDEKSIVKDSQAFMNRMNELLTPEASRYLINQETSSFNPLDVVTGNKLLFVNLAGVSEQVASIIGTMIVTAIWTAAKQASPEKPNFMYLDEFQQFSYLSSDFEDMLATARKRKLGLVIATQYIERLDRKVQDAVMANARTKLIFQSSSNSASIHATDFASTHVRRESFMNLKAHDALARIMTDAGISDPITLHTFPEPPGYNRGRAIQEQSDRIYGRSLAQINMDDNSRRKAATMPTQTVRKDIGRSSYDAGERD